MTMALPPGISTWTANPSRSALGASTTRMSLFRPPGQPVCQALDWYTRPNSLPSGQGIRPHHRDDPNLKVEGDATGLPGYLGELHNRMAVVTE